MTALLLAVYIASVLGSLHCAGMCGPLMACAVSSSQRGCGKDGRITLGDGFGQHARRSQWWSHATSQLGYHCGRLIGYLVLGGIAGGVGALLDLGSTLSGLQPVAAMLAGGTMVVVGLAAIGGVNGLAERWLNRALNLAALGSRAQALANRFNAGTRAMLIGLLTPMLPCGWLYAFVLTSAGTGAVWSGVLVMLAFWLGTLPIMVTLGVGVQGMLGALGQQLFGARVQVGQQVAAVAIVVLGLFTLSGRVQLDATAMAAHIEADANSTPSESMSGDAKFPVVPHANEPPPCCAAKPQTQQTDNVTDRVGILDSTNGAAADAH